MERKSNDKIIIEMYDDNKNLYKYEILDIEIYKDEEYAVMLPEFSIDNQVEIFKLKHTEDKSATLYKPVTDDYIIMQVYEMFKEKFQKNYSNRIKFED